MNIINIIFGIFSAGLSLYAENLIYGKITKIKIDITIVKYLLLFLVFSCLIFLNNTYNINSTTFIIQVLLMTIFNKLTYKEEIINTTIKTSIIFIFLALFEVLLVSILVMESFDNLDQINNNYLFKLLFSIIDLTLTYIALNNGFINKYVNKIIEFLLKKISRLSNVLLLVCAMFIGFTSYKLTFNYTEGPYIQSLMLLLLFIFLLVVLVYKIITSNNEKEKSKILLEDLRKYEELIDKQRINRHELLNNLLTLKSFKNKNGKDFEAALNELIYQNEQNELSGLNSLYNLPSGIKGIMYYKIHEMRNKGIEVVINVDRNTISTFDKLNSKYYVEICRMLGIFLDNAKEATLKTKKKLVVIDVYKEQDDIVIYIENTNKGKVEFERLYQKEYSKKGKNGGIGLYVVKNIINSHDCYELTQEINSSKNFVTKLKIIKEKTSK